MCSPTMASASFGAEAYGEYAAGQNDRTLNRLNARIADYQAKDALERGNAEAARIRQRRNQVVGQQRATFAAQNVDIGTGSAADVQADTVLLSEMDVDTVKANAAREAWGYRTEAATSRFEGNQAAAAGVQRSIRSLIGNANSYGAFASTGKKTVEGIK